MSPIAARVGRAARLLGISTAVAGMAQAHAQESLADRLDSAARFVAAQAVQTALEHRPSGARQEWEVPGAAVGSITPQRTWQSVTGHWCREFEERIRLASGVSQRRVAVRCRAEDGLWKEPNRG